LQRQALEPNRAATAAELKTSVVEFEIVETDSLIWQCTTPATSAPKGPSDSESSWHRLAACGKTPVSYQGIALAIPQVLRNQSPPLGGWAPDIEFFRSLESDALIRTLFLRYEAYFLSKLRVRNSVLPGWPCQAPDGKFFRSVQTASDGLHGRFQESGARSHSLAGFAHRLLVESGEPSEWGIRETGKVLESPKHQRKGLGTSPHFSSETGQPHNPLASSSLPSTQTLFPQAMSIKRVEHAADRVSTQSWNPKKQKLYSIIHSSYPVFTLYLWKSLSGSDLPELCKIGRWQ